MITWSEWQDRLKAALESTDRDSPEKLQQVFTDQFVFGLKNYEELDDRSRKAVDDMKAAFLDASWEAVQSMPDGPEKRAQEKEIAFLRGEHFKMSQLYGRLGPHAPQKHAYIAAAEDAALQILQDALDVMYDARKQAPRGEPKVLVASLLCGSINDLLSAMHLTSRGLSVQSATVLRGCQEKLELCQLFLKDPESIKLWMDESRRWPALKPSAVRRRLGLKAHDLGYKYLSEAGTHPTFMSLHGMSALTRTGAARTSGDEGIRLWIGGMVLPWAVVPLCMSALYKASLVLLVAIEWMQQVKGVPENRDRVERSEAIRAAYMKEHAIPEFRKLGASEEHIARLTGMYEDNDGGGG